MDHATKFSSVILMKYMNMGKLSNILSCEYGHIYFPQEMKNLP